MKIEVIFQEMSYGSDRIAPIAIAVLALGLTAACGLEPGGGDSGQSDSSSDLEAGVFDASAGEPTEKGDPSPEGEPFRVWVAGDAHVHTDLKRSNYRSLEESILDTKTGETAFEWDLWLNPGDFSGTQHCPGDDEGKQLVDQFDGFNRHRMYSVPGNHDLNRNSAGWFRKWVDPFGNHTETSGVDPDSRPYPIEGDGDPYGHYSFQVGNVVFLMLFDKNFGPNPFGRSCDGGYPAGRYTRETFDWWVDQVDEHSEEIVVTVAHHALHRTTTYTEFEQGVKFAHGNLTWADARGSSFIYAIGNHTIDGKNASQEEVGKRKYGFKRYLKEHPGAVDLWLHGHTHKNTHPGRTHDGRSLIETVHGVHFVNAGALTCCHAGADVPFSRVVEFYPGSRTLQLRTFLHRGGWNGQDEGFYGPAARQLNVGAAFEPPNR